MSEIDKLRDEVLNYQNHKHDLLKWKLILTGTVSAVGLGFTGNLTTKGSAALCAVPLIAAYCDLLIRNCDLRIATKSFFILKHGDGLLAEYERFMISEDIAQTKWWRFNNYAVFASSLILCIFLLCAGIFQLAKGPTKDHLVWSCVMTISILGCAGVIGIEFWYHKIFKNIKKLCVGKHIASQDRGEPQQSES